jgi:hypothetical protein
MDKEYLIGKLNEVSDPENDLDPIVEDIERTDDPRSFLPELFRFIEQRHDEDLGSPGPLVRFMEKGYAEGDYFELLKKSMETMPSLTAAWMINRIVNALKNETEKDEWKILLAEALDHPKIDSATKDRVQHFLDFQK